MRITFVFVKMFLLLRQAQAVRDEFSSHKTDYVTIIGSKVTAVFLNKWSCNEKCLRLCHVSHRAGRDQNQEAGFQDVAAETKGVIEVNLTYA